MTPFLAPGGFVRYLGPLGTVLPFGQLYFYSSGTLDEAPVYDADGDVLAQPITADITGAFEQPYLVATITYRVRLLDADDVEIFDIDPYVSGASTSGILPISSFGGLSPSATAAATLADAFASAGRGGALYVDQDIDIGTAPVSNPGTWLLEDRGIYYTPGSGGGRRVENLPARDPSILAWGQECLVRWLYEIQNQTATTFGLCGDSNTEGHLGAALYPLLASIYNATGVNYGVSGTTMEEWRTGTGGFSGGGSTKSMASVIAAAPHLMTICFGTNPSGDIDAEEASWRAALTTIRATLGVQACSILLMTPNAMNATGKDELWSMQLRPMIRQVAQDFQCAFFDQNGMFPDAFVDFGAGPSQNHWLDSARVHTTALSQALLLARLYAFLVPEGIRADASGMITNKASTDLPAVYPKGWSMSRAVAGSSAWPIDGFVLTFNPSSTAGQFPFQINFGFSVSSASFRGTTASNTWGNWCAMGTTTLSADVFDATDPITDFPMGQSVMRATDASWPHNGFVVTYQENGSGGNGYQINWSYNTDVPARFRIFGASSWYSWRTIGNYSGTVASLPSAATAGGGAMAYVTDANATTRLAVAAGGGSNKVMLFSDGTNWLIL